MSEKLAAKLDRTPWLTVARNELSKDIRESTGRSFIQTDLDLSSVRGLKQIGIKSTEGGYFVSHSNPEIEKYFTAVKVWGEKKLIENPVDDVPWCAAFVNWCLQKSGVRGNRNAGASSFFNYGIRLHNPMPGCIAVVSRGRGLYHVAFFISKRSNRLLLLGGNQGNKVCESDKYSAEGAGYCWPDYPPFSNTLKSQFKRADEKEPVSI